MMKTNELADLSLRILTEYSHGHLQLLFNWISDDILWVEPEWPDIIHSAELLRSSLSRNRENMSVRIHYLNPPLVFESPSASSCQIILRYLAEQSVIGTAIKQYRRCMEIIWSLQPSDECQTPSLSWKISSVFCSSVPLSSGLYTSSCVREPAPAFTDGPMSLRIPIRDTDQTTHYIPLRSIIWAESCESHCLLHTTEGEILAACSLSRLYKEYSELFYRPHASYLVNPSYIHSLSHFKLTLTNGAVIPVPEKKFTRVRRDLADYFSSSGHISRIPSIDWKK